MINSKRINYSLSPFIFLTTLIHFIYFILHLLASDSLFHCNIRCSHYICFSPSLSTKVTCACGKSLQRLHRRFGRRSCIFVSIRIKVLNKWKVKKKIMFISKLWVVLMIRVINLMIGLSSTMNLRQRRWTSYEPDVPRPVYILEKNQNIKRMTPSGLQIFSKI